MDRIETIAKLFKELTYVEMMEVAKWFAEWTSLNSDGEEVEQSITTEDMAERLDDWAEQQLEVRGPNQ